MKHLISFYNFIFFKDYFNELLIILNELHDNLNIMFSRYTAFVRGTPIH